MGGPKSPSPPLTQCSNQTWTQFIDDRNCNDFLDSTDRVWWEDVWIAPEELNVRWRTVGLVPPNHSLIGKSTRLIEQYYRFNLRATTMLMLPPSILSIGEEADTQVGPFDYLAMADAIMPELGMMPSDPALIDGRVALLLRAFDHAFAELGEIVAKDIIPVNQRYLLITLHMLLNEVHRFDGDSVRYRARVDQARGVATKIVELCNRPTKARGYVETDEDIINTLALSAPLIGCSAAELIAEFEKIFHSKTTEPHAPVATPVEGHSDLDVTKQLLNHIKDAMVRGETLNAFLLIDQMKGRLLPVESTDMWLFDLSAYALRRIEKNMLGRVDGYILKDDFLSAGQLLEMANKLHRPRQYRLLEERYGHALRANLRKSLQETYVDYAEIAKWFARALAYAPTIMRRTLGMLRIEVLTVAQGLEKRLQFVKSAMTKRPPDHESIQEMLMLADELRTAHICRLFDDITQKRLDTIAQDTHALWQAAPVAPVAVTPIAFTDPRVQLLRSIATHYWDRLTSYPRFASTGTNMIYGPLLDVGQGHLYEGRRIHTENPYIAALFAELTIAKTLQSAPQTIFVLKHAPGIGSLNSNPEWGRKLARDPRNARQTNEEFAGFTRVARSYPHNVAVMVSGASYPAIDPEDRPALFSKPVVQWIRERLGRDVVLVTDDIGTDLVMGYVKGIVRDSFLETTQAGTDLMLYYNNSISFVDHYKEIGAELVASGAVSIDTLRNSVRRILRLKQTLYPRHPLLQDIERTLNQLSVEDLWMQKIILPSGSVQRGRQLTMAKTGGLAFEGVPGGAAIQRAVHDWAEQSPEFIPPFLANNSPQEVANKTSDYNSAREIETELMRKFDLLVAKFPSALSPELFQQILDEIITRQ